jgi:xanthine/CO dehydrogenase XdhC/CoxF family maturation factor
VSSGSVGGKRAVLETANAMRAAGSAFALIIVVRTEGSTYRKPGALALVGADGVHIGVVSGGCLESGVELVARDALRAGAPRLAVFDTRSDDDLIFGSGSGCRGRMHVLALPSRSSGRHVDAIIDAGLERRPLTLAIDELAPGLLASGELTIRPPPQVLVLGAGPEAPPLLDIARTLGWYCCVVDHREALLAPGRVGVVDRRLQQRPAAALRELAGERFDAALVMTHVADADLEALRSLASADIAYVGLLGPAGRRDELLARLSAPEREALNGRLHAPIGLPLGGEGPEAIALSIAAELQKLGIGA